MSNAIVRWLSAITNFPPPRVRFKGAGVRDTLAQKSIILKMTSTRNRLRHRICAILPGTPSWVVRKLQKVMILGSVLDYLTSSSYRYFID